MCHVVIQSKQHGPLVGFSIDRLGESRRLHIGVYLVDTLIELTYPLESRENPGYGRIARPACATHVVERHDIGKTARTADFHAVIVNNMRTGFPCDSYCCAIILPADIDEDRPSGVYHAR